MTFFCIKKIFFLFVCVFVTVLCVFAPLPEYIRGPEKGRTPTSDVLNSDRPEYPSRLTNLFIPSTVQPKSTLLLRPFNRYIFYIRMRIYFCYQ